MPVIDISITLEETCLCFCGLGFILGLEGSGFRLKRRLEDSGLGLVLGCHWIWYKSAERWLLEVYRATVIEKVWYASSAWWGFTSADDRQHLDGFIRRSVRQGYCASDVDTVGMIDQANEKLFHLVLTNPNHVLSSLLPDKTDQRYYLRARRHDRQLVDKYNRLLSDNFMIRMLCTVCYWERW